MVLSLFRNSPKEGTLTYTDWHREVEECNLRKGYDNDRIKDTMLSSVDWQAYVNFCSCDEGRKTPCKEHRGRHPTNAKKEEDRHKGKVVLSLFRDSLKEGTLTRTGTPAKGRTELKTPCYL